MQGRSLSSGVYSLDSRGASPGYIVARGAHGGSDIGGGVRGAFETVSSGGGGRNRGGVCEEDVPADVQLAVLADRVSTPHPNRFVVLVSFVFKFT